MIDISTINPEEFKASSSKFKILYGEHSSPFGNCLIGISEKEKALCHLWFLDDNLAEALEFMKKEWSPIELIENKSETGKIAKIAFSDDKNDKIRVLLKGTDFQIAVWKSLIQIPEGKTITYGDVAELIGNPKAIRAAAKVVASNKIAFVIPCHRVLPKTGISKYRWNTERRLSILEYEKKHI